MRRDARVAAIRLHCRTRRAADVLHGALPAYIQTLHRGTPCGMAPARTDTRAARPEQISRSSGAHIRPCGQRGTLSAPSAAYRASAACGNSCHSRHNTPPALAIPARLGIVRIPPFGTQRIFRDIEHNRFSGQHAGCIFTILCTAVGAGIPQGEARNISRAYAVALPRSLHRILPRNVAARICPAAMGHSRSVRARMAAIQLCTCARANTSICNARRMGHSRIGCTCAYRDDI